MPASLSPAASSRAVARCRAGHVDHRAAPVGQDGWDGGLGTVWRNDPTEQLTAILLTNAARTSPRLPEVASDFLAATYPASPIEPRAAGRPGGRQLLYISDPGVVSSSPV